MNLSEIQGLSDRDLTRVVGKLTAGHPDNVAVRAAWALKAEVIRLRAELASAREREGKLVSAHETSQRLRIDQTERMAELERELANERSIHEQVRDWWEEQAQLAQRLYRERDAAVATAEALREAVEGTLTFARGTVAGRHTGTAMRCIADRLAAALTDYATPEAVTPTEEA